TLPAAPAVTIVTPAQGATVAFGARVLIEVSGVNRTFTATTLGLPPRIVVNVNGVPWSYRDSDWVAADVADPGVLVLQADLVALPVPGSAQSAAPALPARSVTTAPPVNAVYDPRAGATEVVLHPLEAVPGLPPIPRPVDISNLPWTRRA